MKYILQIIIFMLSLSIFGQERNNFDYDDKKFNDVVSMIEDENTDVIVDGTVIDTSVNEYVIDENKPYKLNNIVVFTVARFKVNNSYKKNTITDEIEVVIEGGYLNFEGKLYKSGTSNGANPFLEKGDRLIMILKQRQDGKYFYYFGKEAEILGTEELINNVEDQYVYLKNKHIDKNTKLFDYEKDNLKRKNQLDSYINANYKNKLLKNIKKYLNNKQIISEIE